MESTPSLTRTLARTLAVQKILHVRCRPEADLAIAPLFESGHDVAPGRGVGLSMSRDSVSIWSEEAPDGQFVGCYRILHQGIQTAQDRTARAYATRYEAEEAARSAASLARDARSSAEIALRY